MEQNVENFSIVPWLNQDWNHYVYPDYRCWIWWADRDDERAASESSGASSEQWAKLSGAIPRKKIMAWYVHGLSIFHKFIPEVDRPFVSLLTTDVSSTMFRYMKFSFTRLGTVMREFAKNKLDIRKNNFFDAIFTREIRKWSN